MTTNNAINSPLPTSLADGGTAAALVASNGGIFYSTASTGAILAGTATADQILLSGSSTAPIWSTATYPATTTTNQILYSSSANVIGGLTTANNGILITSSGGVPSISSTLPSTVQGNITSLGTIISGTWNATPVTVSFGGTGNTTFTAYSVICAGITATGTFQNVSGLGTSGQVLTSNGASSLPTWQTVSGTGTVTSVTGTSGQIDVATGTTTPVISIDVGYVGQTSITTLGTIVTGTWSGTTITVSHGGTGNTTFTAYSLICAGTTATGTFQNVSGVGTSGQVLTSNGASNLPTWQALPTAGTVTSVSGTSGQIDVVNGTTTPVISIDAGYVGQTSITTLGTITTGTWNGTAVTVSHGGTGNNNFTAYSVVCAGTTTTGAFQNVVGTGTSGQVLTSTGTSSLPVWQTVSGTGTVTSVTGTTGQIDVATGTTTPVISIDAGYVGQTSITTLGTITTGTWNGTPVTVPYGGTGNNTFTAYSLICAGTTATGTFQNVSGIGTSGQVLTSNGASSLPTWQSLPATGTVTSVSGTAGQIDVASGTTTPVISIDSGYVGQTSITTLGTITTGTWNGTTVTVSHGGTGNNTFTAYSVLCAGTTSTGIFQNVVGTGTSGQVLTSTGASSLPTWQTVTGTGTVTSVSGTSGQIDVATGTTTPVISIDAGYVGQTSITTLGTVTTGTWTGTTITVPHGGTGNTTFTAYSLICAGTTATGTFQNVSGVGTSGQVLTSNGASFLPTWQTLPVSGTVTSVSGTAGQIDVVNGTTTPVISIDAGYVGQTSITTLGTITTGTWNGTTITVSHGGTGSNSFTPFSVLCAGNTSTGAFSNVTGVGASGQVLTSNGASTIPSWQNTSAITSLSTGVGITGGSPFPITSTGTVVLDLSVVTQRAFCYVASAFNLSATYNNGTSGVGATLINNSTQTVLTIDGTGPIVGDRILVNGQTTAAQNGIYTVTSEGSSSSNWILTRATDFDGSIAGSIAYGVTVWVTNGTTYPQTTWMTVVGSPFTIGTSSINFTNGIANLTFSNAIISTSLPTLNIENTNSGGTVLLSTNSTSLAVIGSGLTNNIVLDAQTVMINPLSATSSILYFGNNNVSNTYIGIGAPGTGTLQDDFYKLPPLFPSTSQLLYCNSSGVMSWGAAGSIPWTSVTTTTQTLAAGNNYLANDASLITFSLPTTSSFGDTYVILGSGAGGWKVAQNSGQQIIFDTTSTTSGTGGSLASTSQHNSITLVCTVANTTWGVTSSIGSITVV